jgi:hypothetical protein
MIAQIVRWAFKLNTKLSSLDILNSDYGSRIILRGAVELQLAHCSCHEERLADLSTINGKTAESSNRTVICC